MYSNTSIRRDLMLLFAAIALFFAIGLGTRAYLNPSEARYIEIPRQMIVTGDWLTPHINGVPYFEKPPLYYWLQAGTMSVFGTNEFSGRIMPLLIVTLTCLLTYALGRNLYGRTVGLSSAATLATSLLAYGLSRTGGLDAPLTLFITAALFCFLTAQKTTGNARRNFYWLIYVFAALAMMTKGLIGVVIPGMVIGAWIVSKKEWSILKEARLASGTLIFLAIAAPWHVMMARIHPDFLNFYFIHEHFTRYMTDEHKRTAPWWFFIVITIAGLLPWTGLLPVVLKKMRDKLRPLSKADPVEIFFALWIVLPLAFFSASHSKLVPYIFPIFPPLSILLGRYLADLWEGKIGDGLLRLSMLLVVFIFSALLIAIRFVPLLHGKAAETLSILNDMSWAWLFPLVIGLIVLLYAVVSRVRTRTSLLLLAGFAAILDLSVNFIVATHDVTSTKLLATELNEHLKPEDMVVAYHSYWQDLPVYLNRNVTVVGWMGELSEGVTHYPETHQWMIDDEEFWKRCAAAPNTVYVFIDQNMVNTLPNHKGCVLEQAASYGKTLVLAKSPPVKAGHGR